MLLRELYLNESDNAETNELIKLTVGTHPKSERYGVSYFVAYNGRFLGDDRSFSTKQEAEAEIDKRLEKDARDAKRYDRPLLYVKGY